MLVDSIQKADDIVKLLSQPGNFPTLSAGTKFQGEPLQQGRKIHGVCVCV